MALDKKQIALSVVGIVSGLALTYILWRRSQQSNAQAAATAAANAAAAATEQEQQSQQFDAVYSGLSNTGASGGVIYQSTAPTTTGTTTDDSTNDITGLITSLLGNSSSSVSSVPGNDLIPEIDVSDSTTALSGVDTTAAEILGSAPPSTVSSTTTTGQTYGATTASTAGLDSNPPVAAPISATGGGGNPTTVTITGSIPVTSSSQLVSTLQPAL